jgi:hypothetical protein
MPVIPVNRVVDTNRIIGKNGGPRMRRGHWPKKLKIIVINCIVFNRNPRAHCHDSPDLDLNHWKEEVTQCRVNGLDIVLGSSRKISPCTSCTCTKEGVSTIFAFS